MKNHNHKAVKAELEKQPIFSLPHTVVLMVMPWVLLCALSSIKTLGHKVSVVVPNSYAEFLHWLPFNDDVVEFEGNEELANNINEAELIFCLDFNDLRRTDMMCKALEQSSGKFVMIDHHQDPSDFADMVFSEPNICSTAQLIFDFIEDMEERILNIDVANVFILVW